MATIFCSKCGQQIEEHAAFCIHCGAKQTKEGSEETLANETPTNETSGIAPAANYGVILLAIPIIAAVVLLAGTAGVAGFELSTNGVTGIMLGAILATAVVASIEASKVGMKMDRSKGTYGPVIWLIVMALLWIIAYPVYMFKRKHYGLPNRVIAALVVAFVFVLSPAIIDPADGTSTESIGSAEMSPAEDVGQANSQEQQAEITNFKCSDYPQLAMTADATIRHLDDIKPLPQDKKKLMGPDLQHSDFYSQEVPDKFVEICTAMAYFYDNTSYRIVYTVSLINNDTEWFVAVQDKQKFNVDMYLADLKRQGEEENRKKAQQLEAAEAEPVKVAAESPEEPVQPSFDCKNATIKVEKLICENPELARWDVTLVQAYEEVMVSVYAGEAMSLANAQKEWIKSRNQCESVKCIAEAYQHRHEELAPWEYERHE